MARALPVFSDQQREFVHRALALRVALMMGRKMEEADWTDIYEAAFGLSPSGWSNLEIDVMRGNVGVEIKMLRYQKESIEDACGTSLMHPALTRSFRIDSSEPDPERAKELVFAQYADLVKHRREAVEAQNTTGLRVEMRSGWLIWQTSLRQFLYFEEPMHVPAPDDYFAEWRDSGAAGARRKPSRNLWIYDKRTRQKRYSVTTDAGAKIQPYFDVPPAKDPNLYLFTVVGEQVDVDHVRLWVTQATAQAIQRAIGSINPSDVEEEILTIAELLDAGAVVESPVDAAKDAVPIILTAKAYETLTAHVPGVNDDHRLQVLLDYGRRFK